MIPKTIIASCLAGALLIAGIPAWAQEQEPVSPENTPAVMTVDDAVAYALEHSLTIASANSAIENARYSRTQAKFSMDSRKQMDSSAASFDDGLMLTGYYVSAAETQLAVAQRNLLTAQNTLTIQVQNDFYTYLNAKDKVEIARTNLKSAQEKLEYAKAKKDSGAISELDYAAFELSAQDAQNKLNQAERAVELAELQVKFTINYPRENPLTLQGAFTSPSITVKDADQAVLASKGHVNYLNLQDSLRLAEERWEHAQGWYFPIQPGYNVEKSTYETAQADFLKNTNDLEMGIRSAFHNLQTSKESIQYAQENIALLQRSTEAAQLQYEMGMITANDLIDSQQQYFSAQNQLKDLELTYLTAALQYRSMYTYEDDGSIH